MRIPILACLFSALLLTGCLPPKTVTVGATATLLEDVAKSSNRQSDLKTVREGTPSYLMLMDGMIGVLPSNARLLLGAAEANASFASAFVEDEDQDRARLLFGKAKVYAQKALELKGLKSDKVYDDFEKDLGNLGKEDVPYLFVAATAWGSCARGCFRNRWRIRKAGLRMRE